ncbi:hypothetical protein, partial [Bartonella henselae]|uniref:hypothetical protein n=1 Tax=Bartonella henselae TaxID=38323 RepID=UPI001ABBDF2A
EADCSPPTGPAELSDTAGGVEVSTEEGLRTTVTPPSDSDLATEADCSPPTGPAELSDTAGGVEVSTEEGLRTTVTPPSD